MIVKDYVELKFGVKGLVICVSHQQRETVGLFLYCSPNLEHTLLLLAIPAILVGNKVNCIMAGVIS